MKWCAWCALDKLMKIKWWCLSGGWWSWLKIGEESWQAPPFARFRCQNETNKRPSRQLTWEFAKGPKSALMLTGEVRMIETLTWVAELEYGLREGDSIVMLSQLTREKQQLYDATIKRLAWQRNWLGYWQWNLRKRSKSDNWSQRMQCATCGARTHVTLVEEPGGRGRRLSSYDKRDTRDNSIREEGTFRRSSVDLLDGQPNQRSVEKYRNDNATTTHLDPYERS